MSIEHGYRARRYGVRCGCRSISVGQPRPVADVGALDKVVLTLRSALTTPASPQPVRKLAELPADRSVAERRPL